MKIRVMNTENSAEYDKETKEFVKSAAEFAAEYLSILHLDNKVLIGLSDKIETEGFEGKDAKTLGLYVPLSDGLSLIYVAVQGRSRIDIASTIFHEMVHLKQKLLGELCHPLEDKPSLKLWKGVSYGKAQSFEEYYTTPWEVEARDLTEKMVWIWLIEKMPLVKIIRKILKKSLTVLKKLV